MKEIKTIACIAGMMMASALSAQVTQQILGEKHAMLRIDLSFHLICNDYRITS